MKHYVLYLKTPGSPRHGFTVIELLIAILIIAILATLTVVAYRGVSNSSVEASMKSDLHTAAAVLESDRFKNNEYPAIKEHANNGNGLSTSGHNHISYESLYGKYCLLYQARV